MYKKMTPMNRILHLLLLSLLFQYAQGQSIGIGTATPQASALVQVSSTTQGILAPRLSSAQRNAIVNPATGLLVFQTDGEPGFCYYSGIAWINLTRGYALNDQGYSSNYGRVSTLAGGGGTAGTDGRGAAATFNTAAGVAVDLSGNLYVADAHNNKIRKITVGGVVSTLAGSGVEGSADGVGTTASFNTPWGVAVDVSGNLYVADLNNNKIRKITAAGVVSTLAGSGAAGSLDGAGAAASFNGPYGIAVDIPGNVYVADAGNNEVRKITVGGMVSTLAGSTAAGFADGVGTAASFSGPYGIAVDIPGNVYVADAGNAAIRKITAGGLVTTLVNTGTAAPLYHPASIAVDASGNLYISDLLGNTILKRTNAGVQTVLAGNGIGGYADGVGTEAFFYFPYGIAVDAAANVYVGDALNNAVRKIIAY